MEDKTNLSQRDEMLMMLERERASVCVCVCFKEKEDAISFGCLLGTRAGSEIKIYAALFLGLERGCDFGGAT